MSAEGLSQEGELEGWPGMGGVQGHSEEKFPWAAGCGTARWEGRGTAALQDETRPPPEMARIPMWESPCQAPMSERFAKGEEDTVLSHK